MERWMTTREFTILFGSHSYGFSKVSNLSGELEYDSISEGGRNWSPLLFRKARTKQDVMTLERGVRTECGDTDVSLLKVGVYLEAVLIMICSGRQIGRTYTFDEGVITKLQMSDLNAMGNEILIDRMEIAHSGLYEI